jgi:hypothetical protein
MRSRLLLLILAASGLAAISSAQQIRNWTAAPYWSPPASDAETVSEREKGALASRTAGILSTQAASAPLPFVAITPCRLVDTRGNGFTGAFGPPAMIADQQRNFPFAGQCGIPGNAAAVSANFTVTSTQGLGFIQAFPQGDTPPTVSTLNYLGGQTIANAAIVPLGAGGGLTVIAGLAGTQLIIDVNGYYAPIGLGDGTIFNFTGNAVVNSTLAISGSTNSASPNQLRSAGPLPVACTLDSFFVFMDTAPTVLTTFTLQKNANDGLGFQDTNATCSIGVGGNACQAVTPSVSFAAGNLAMTNVTGAAGAGGRASVSWRCR